MKFLTRLCRLILGAVFVFSGFLKLIDPVGTSLVIKEYFEAFHLSFLDFAVVPAAVALALLEFTIGVSMLVRLRIRFMAWVTLIVMSFFTLVTLYLAVFNPISDCGCFGEAIHLTNWQTFFKNLILLPCAVVIFIWRSSISEFKHPVAEWIFMLLFVAFGAGVAVHVSRVRPVMEFSSLSIGNDLAAAPSGDSDSYETTFIYEKNGEKGEFPIDNLPDSTWTFVDAVTVGSEETESSSDADFYVENVIGTDITPDILSRRNLLVVSIYDPEKFYGRYSDEDIDNLRQRAMDAGFDFMTVASMIYGDIESADAEGMVETGDYLCTDPMACDTFPGLADRKLLMTLNRSNGGMTYLDEGRIIKKWAAPSAFNPSLNLADDADSELALLEESNRQRSTVVMCVIALLLGYIVKIIVFKLLKHFK